MEQQKTASSFTRVSQEQESEVTADTLTKQLISTVSTVTDYTVHVTDHLAICLVLSGD